MELVVGVLFVSSSENCEVFKMHFNRDIG